MNTILRPGVWTQYMNGLDPEEMVTEFSLSDWKELELSDEHSKILLERGDPVKTGNDFKKHAENSGISFPQGHLWLACDIIGKDSDRILDGLKAWLDMYEAIGIKSAVLHPGGRELATQGADEKEILEKRVNALTELCAHIKNTDMCICLENIPSTAPYAEDLLRIIDAVNSKNLGICLDTSHLNMMKNGSPGTFISQAGKHLKALHLSDNEGETDQHLIPFSRGTVDWEETVNALAEIKYPGLFNYEIPGENGCPIEIRRLKLNYLKKITDYMFSLV